MPVKYFKHPTAIVETDDVGEDSKIWHFVHIREKAKVGKNCNIGKDAYIDTEVEIGDNVKIQNFVSVYRGVKIQDDVFVGPSVTFTNDLYPRAFIWNEKRIAPTIVKKGASIGAGSIIICGTTIGEYAMIGAGSIITRDVPSFGLVYGNPAHLRGFVCYCGKKLEAPAKEESKKTVFRCACGKTVEILKE